MSRSASQDTFRDIHFDTVDRVSTVGLQPHFRNTKTNPYHKIRSHLTSLEILTVLLKEKVHLFTETQRRCAMGTVACFEKQTKKRLSHSLDP